MVVATLVFYLFAVVLITAAIMVVAARNPVHSVMFLILAFFNAAGLFLLIGAEYLAMTLIIVYVGAVAVLFLFVVMMLNVNFAELRQGFLRYLPMGGAVAAVFFAELFIVIAASLRKGGALAERQSPVPVDGITNTQAIGNVLYTDFIYLFQLSGLVLLVAMIGAIVLTLRHKPDARRQNIHKQLGRKRSETMRVVKLPSGAGAQE